MVFYFICSPSVRADHNYLMHYQHLKKNRDNCRSDALNMGALNS